MGNINDNNFSREFEKVRESLRMRNIKTEINKYKICDIVKTCSSCLGYINFDSNGSFMDIDDINCDYNIGLTEGIIEGIAEIMKYKEKWNIFISLIKKKREKYEMREI